MARSPSSPKVLVTGASGFIGLHTVLHLLQHGYRVHATVRSEAKASDIRATLSRHVDTRRLGFSLADLVKDDGWQAAMRGCDYVIHTASPFPAVPPRYANEVIVPARDGTLRVLRAAQAEGVRRVVILSSLGAVYGGHEGENRSFNETDWTYLGKCRDPYRESKTLAERLAWDFIYSAENESKMELVAINPSWVFGPVLDGHPHTATEWYRTLMRAEVPGVAHMQLDFVDVRDLVDIFEKALTNPEADGKRFLCNAASIPLPEFASILKGQFSSQGYHVPTRILPDLFVRLLALFNPKVKSVAYLLQWKYTLSTEETRWVFNWEPRPYKQTILDMAESLIEFGLV